MSEFEAVVKTGIACFEGKASYEFSTCHLGFHSLAVSRYSKPHIQDETGPHFTFCAVNSRLLRDAIFSHLCYDFELPCTYQFVGPVLGYVRAYSGYAAASSGGDQRPIEQIDLSVNLDKDGLAVEITGRAGHIIEIDCCSKNERFTKKQFSVSFAIDIPLIPAVIDIRTGENVFERRFLGANVATDVYPRINRS